MTEAERITKARELRLAIAARRDFAQSEIDSNPDDQPEPWWNAQHAIVDSCWDKIRLIDGLFPELDGIVDGKHR